ncbi:primosomal protein N' [Desulfuromonas carbonis]|uniref:replication restart helicase PriA n=1 Tax=Desulfuromonas sp. DDH964 TaxID=1823759 RepID=UPI00078EA6F0|nr:primosomal protein N' [Desulfuromonas sp. DDH964]AMV71464.1 primosomal protein N' [Desulfuromonas sp. DDH964]
MTESALIATVAVAAPLAKPYSYLVPAELRDQARVGMRLEVPLGRRQVVGYLLALGSGDAAGLKAIRRVLDPAPLLTPQLIRLLLRAADYYRHPPGEVIRCALPAGLSGKGNEVSILHEAVYTALPRDDQPAGSRQREVLAQIRAAGPLSLSTLRTLFAAPHAPLKRLVELGFLAVEEVERHRDPFLDLPLVPDRPAVPTAEQAAGLEQIAAAIAAGGFRPLLLHGVTGSGKTEVYLQAIAGALAAGRRALVLVPEIALTPQLVARFRARFGAGKTIAVLHSGLSDGERYDAWRAIAAGEIAIVIGARSAIFAPLAELGILVVDEEHEASYKQAEGFRYHARDLALLRGQMEGATVLLGSATPALTSFQRAREGQIGYLSLGNRVGGRPMPAVELLDLRQAAPAGVLAPPLVKALTETLERGEQALLLLNRRGFSPFLLCADCGTTFRCPNCEITLTYHQGERRLRCHYCDYVERPAELCPGCNGINILPQGAGTERLEEELAVLLPGARVARMDRDTTTRKGAHRALVEEMLARKIDILVGTQMVAKGHDFPGVTLVGVASADATLNFPDFRSAERTFTLLAQVAGRAGRGDRPGQVLIQTYSPEHYALQCAAQHDYLAFAEQELAFRRELGYPPYGYLVNLVFSGNNGEQVEAAADRFAAGISRHAGAVEVLGPAPCPLARLRGRHRRQLLLKSATRPALRHLLDRLPPLQKSLPAAVSLAIDVDPVDML